MTIGDATKDEETPSDRGQRLDAALTETSLGPVTWTATTGSTNSDCVAAAGAGAAPGLVFVADHQSAGRGRLGRRWIAQPGASLLMSVLVEPGLSMDRLHLSAMAAALAGASAIEHVTGIHVSIKWPNDLLIGGTKVAGILAETVAARPGAVVVGIGVNVDWPDQVTEIDGRAVTALNRWAPPPDRVELAAELLVRLDFELRGCDADGGAALVERYRAVCATVGGRVRVEGVDGVLEAVAVGLDDDGALLVDAGGEITPVRVGDVVHLHPA